MTPAFASRLCFVLLLLAGLGLAAAASPQDQAGEKLDDGVEDVVFLGDQRPVLIRLRILIDGKTVKEHQKEYIEQWFRYLDVNEDGFLSADEILRAPSGQEIARSMTLGFSNFAAPKGRPSLANMSRSDKASPTEFQDYYRRFTPPLQVYSESINPEKMSLADSAIFKALDANEDGKLSAKELQAAPRALAKFDVNGDECLSVQELTGEEGPPGIQVIPIFQHQGYTGQVGRFFHIQPGQKHLAALLLSMYDRDKSRNLDRAEIGLDKAAFDKLDANHDGLLDLEELAHWHERPADLEFTLRLGKESAVSRQDSGKDVKVKNVSVNICQFALQANMIHLVSPETLYAGPDPRGLRRFLLSEFSEADKKKRGFVERADLKSKEILFLQELFFLIDRDGDGKVTEKEIERFLELAHGGGDCCVFLYVTGMGRSLFDFLDANRDGRLSPRELHQACDRLKPVFDIGKTGFITLGEILVQHQLTVRRGRPRDFEFGGLAPKNISANAPEWFRKMDINGDGDVSFAEFLGTREEFERIDTDRDGFISAEEATRHDRLLRKAK